MNASVDFIDEDRERSYLKDRKAQSAVERELLVVSEAVSRLLEMQNDGSETDFLEARFQNIPWAKIRGIGNALRHEHGRTLAPIIWNAVTCGDLEKLRDALVQRFPDAT